MLAGTPKDVNDIEFPVLVSPKLDGIRFNIVGGRVLSRNGLPFKNTALQERFGRPEFNGLDGEIMCGDPTHPEAFRRCAVANSYNGNVDDVVMYVFDDFTHPSKPYAERLIAAGLRILNQPWWKMVEHRPAFNVDDLATLEAAYLELGYEGAMVRHPNGPYKYGRSTAREGWLLKIKQFHDSDAVIDDAEEKLHNANEKTLVRAGKAARNTQRAGMVPTGVLGSLVVRDIHTGVQFSVGSGFTDADRADLWVQHQRGELAGRTIRYSYFPSGGKNKPRFPVFLGFREDV